MNFDFSEEQHQFREQVRRLVVDLCPVDEVRRVLDGRAERADRLWQAMGEMGLLGAGVPESFGGVGLGVEELCLAAEELGRALAPVPFLSSRGLAMEALLRRGDEAFLRRWMPRLATGEITAAYASPRTSLLCLRGDQTLSGEITPVAGALGASLLVVAMEDLDEKRLVVVETTQPGVTVEAVATLDPTLPQARVVLDGAGSRLLAEGAEAEAAILATERVGALIAAFEQLGGAERCLEMARDYALQRRAFGRLIGSFQAIKHRLVEMYGANTLARAHAYHGAWAMGTNAEVSEVAVAGARVSATEAFNFAAQENLHLHGGLGFTWESDCHLFYRRARQRALCLGSLLHWKERVVDALETASAA